MIDPKRVEFRCTCCGKCCERPGWVHFTPSDRRRAARRLGMPVAEFRRVYGDDGDGTWIEVTRSGPCPFYEDRSCVLHPAKPEQCRTFPLWREYLKSRAAWNALSRFCPGSRPLAAPGSKRGPCFPPRRSVR